MHGPPLLAFTTSKYELFALLNDDTVTTNALLLPPSSSYTVMYTPLYDDNTSGFSVSVMFPFDVYGVTDDGYTLSSSIE